MSNIQKTLVKHRNAVLVPSSTATDVVSSDVVLTALIELKNLGYTLDRELLESVVTTSRGSFVNWARNVISALKELKGAQFKYTPMYPNFPKQVATAHQIELFANAMVHYLGDWFGYRYLPGYTVETREPLIVDEEKFITLTSATNKVLEGIFVNLIGGKISLNEALASDVKAIQQHLGYTPIVLDIPNKENFATYLGFFDFSVDRVQVTELIGAVNNPLDILRIVAGKGGSDPALTGKVVFAPVPRWMRKTILATLDKFSTEQLAESFRARARLWKLFLTHIHAGEYKQFTVVQEVITTLRSGTLKNSFNSKLEKAIAERDLETVIRLLSSRPTIFVRRLREVATVFPDGWQIPFLNYGKEASLTSLLQALTRFESSNNNYVITSAGRKGRTGVYAAKTWLEEDEKAEVATLIKSTIKAKLNKLPSIGKVYYAPVEGHKTVPFGLRSSGDSNRLLGKGSRLPFDKDATLRFFIHWKDLPFSRVDVDLSASLLDENFNRIKELAFYNLRGGEGQHSGDITSAPNGAAEFVDINIPLLRQYTPKARYIAMSGIVYTGQPFDSIPETMAGFMVREGDPQKGEIFDARTVDTAFTITSPSRNVIPFLFDVITGEAIWLDINTHVTRPAYIAAQIAGQNNVLANVATKRYVSVDELLSFHVDARATELVDSPEDADVVIDANKITFDEILSEWL